MKDEDFKECPFIDSELKFYTFTDFYNNRHAIKRLYNKLGKNGRYFYKWYVYANIHMKLNYKNKVWEWLNGDNVTEDDLKYYNNIYKII